MMVFGFGSHSLCLFPLSNSYYLEYYNFDSGCNNTQWIIIIQKKKYEERNYILIEVNC